ncbi:MAG: DUF5680 domain-containing protein [Patescibacteria group bacterium]
MDAQMQDIERAFFNAMAAGWAQDTEKSAGTDFPHMKLISFADGDYQVVDGYLSPPQEARRGDGFSAGMTVISESGIPVWTMQYGGRYAKQAIPFLKECLHRAYVKERLFYGGRGPHFVRGDRFTYVNNIVQTGFNNFSGEEYVYDLNEQCMGFHWYRGMALLRVPERKW